MLIRHTDGRETIDNYVGCCMMRVSARSGCRFVGIRRRRVSGRKCGTSANVCIAVSIPTTHYEELTITNISTTATNITPNPYVNHK